MLQPEVALRCELDCTVFHQIVPPAHSCAALCSWRAVPSAFVPCPAALTSTDFLRAERVRFMQTCPAAVGRFHRGTSW